MQKVANAITKFIDQISTRLPYEVEILGVEKSPMFGFELKLTGVKDVDGKPIEDGKLYTIDVPVYRGREFKNSLTDEYWHEVGFTDHRKQLRDVYLSKGLLGVYSYLRKYMAPSEVEKVQKYFMQING